MTCKPDPWATQWLERKRESDPEGTKGWTVEKRKDTHYLKWGTTKWDPVAKKYRKKSRHLGVLNPNGTVTEPRRRGSESDVDALAGVTVRDYGDALLLKLASERVAGPLERAFPGCWRELLAMAELRVLEEPRMNQASDAWRLVEDERGLNPSLSPGRLADALESAGADPVSMESFFEEIDDGDRHAATDLSVIFSRSGGMSMLRKGYNRFRLQCAQFNLAAICGVDSGRPCRLCMVCGNVKEGSVVGMLERMGVDKGTVLIMDRGYCSRTLLESVKAAGYDFIVAAKRNSAAYGEVAADGGHFVWEGHALDHGTGRHWGWFAYRYEDAGLRASEIYDMYRAEEERGREPGDRSKAGNVMVLSSLNIHAKDIYRLYKERVAVEGFFDTCKSDLGGDATYLSTDRKVMGYNFVTFLAFCIWWELRDMLRKGGLESRLTPHSLLRRFSAVKVFHTPQGRVASDVPKDVRDVASKIGVELTSGYIPQKV